MRSMFWSVVLIVAIAYMAGLCLLHGCTAYLQEQGDSVDQEVKDAIYEFWGSVSIAMLSLYMATTSGTDWEVVAQPLHHVGSHFYVFFLLYIAFFLFVIMNTLTSLFVEATIINSDRDHQQLIQMEMERKEEYVGKLKAFYSELSP